jgi:hypothetical protein
MTVFPAAVRPLLPLGGRRENPAQLRSGRFSHGLRQMARDLGLDFFSELMLRHDLPFRCKPPL